MAYSVHNFEQGDILYASQLNEMDAQIALNEENISTGISADMLAEDYSANKTYSIGDYVIYNDQLYTCIYEITAPEGWNSAHWQIANLGDGISHLNNAINPLILYSGKPANGRMLFTRDDLHGATKFYYSFDVPSGRASFIELYDSTDTRREWFGKGSSSSGDLSYVGNKDVADWFAYAKFNTNDPTYGESTVNYFAVYLTSELIGEIVNSSNVINAVIDDGVEMYASEYCSSSSTGDNVGVSYAFGANHIYLPKGKRIYAHVKSGFTITLLLKYDKFGDYTHEYLLIGSEELIYTADEDCFVNLNIAADDPSTTYNNDYIEKSGLVVYTDYKPEFKANSGKLLSRTVVSPDNSSRYIRNPSVTVMQNKNTLCVFDSKTNLQDLTSQYVAYSIFDSTNSAIQSGTIEEMTSDVFMQTMGASFNLPNGDVGVIYMVIFGSATGEEELKYAISEDYGHTWGTPETIDAIDTNKHVYVSPCVKPIYVDTNIILIPIWRRTIGDIDGSTAQSGIMRLNLQDLTHSEKYVATGLHTSECNVWIDGDGNAILSCRKDNANSRLYYKIDTTLSGEFELLQKFIDPSLTSLRLICEEGSFIDDGLLYITRHDSLTARNKLTLFCSDCLGRRSKKILDLSNGITNEGYSCVDVYDGVIYVLSEGSDKVIPRGKCLFLDRIIMT